ARPPTTRRASPPSWSDDRRGSPGSSGVRGSTPTIDRNSVPALRRLGPAPDLAGGRLAPVRGNVGDRSPPAREPLRILRPCGVVLDDTEPTVRQRDVEHRLDGAVGLEEL